MLPDGLTAIKSYAFSHCENLYGIYIPASVTSIWGSAFEFCPNDIVIYTERDCEGLTFAKNYDLIFVLESNPESDFTTTVISDSECRVTGYKGTATDIFLPETIGGRTVTAVASNAFKGNTKITSFSALNSVSSIGSYAFRDCTSLTHIQLTDMVTQFPENSYQGCTKLRSISIISFG